MVKKAVYLALHPGRGGEMANAGDLKSPAGNGMRVRVPPSAPTENTKRSSACARVGSMDAASCGLCIGISRP
jgi:hypothetical protein